MSDYIGITEAQSNPFAPLTSELVKQLRDNPIAIAEGAAGAPRLYLRSLEQLEAGDQIRSRRDEEREFEGAAVENPIYSFSFIQFGAIRVRYDVRVTSGSGTARVRRIRNGVSTVVNSFSVTNTSYTTVSVDVSVIAGDTILVTGEAGAANVIVFRNLRFSTGGQDLWPGSSVRLEGNRAAT